MNKITHLLLDKNKFLFHSPTRNNIKLIFGGLHNYCSVINENIQNENTSNQKKRKDFKHGPGLSDFILSSLQPTKLSNVEDYIPYLNNNLVSLTERKVFFDVYGCQMNVNDTEIVWSILKSNNFIKTDKADEADVILIMTCAIRDSAESKIWSRLDHLRGLKRRQSKLKRQIKIGILGCMAERLKHQLLEKEQAVDIVAGPDSYKDLPRLLAITENNQTAVNVLLSLDETYADIMPTLFVNRDVTVVVVRVRREDSDIEMENILYNSSIMRGCDNMCTYCIVPFTRGRERSRPLESIVQEIKHLSDEGVKEVTLLGQNVNSYRFVSELEDPHESTNLAKGFKTVYKIKTGGLRFADLLDKVSAVDPEMRIRFTSPHPKDFPDEVLDIIKERKNICKSLHLPAQSGSSAVLERMRRGYTRETYLELIEHVRDIIPNVTLSSDFICGFCHETDEEFEETLTLIDKVKYNVAYLFPYSMREKTTAHRRYQDNVPDKTKQERVKRMVETFRKGAEKLNIAQIGEIQIILVEGKSKRSDGMLAGRNDGNIKVIIPAVDIPTSCSNKLVGAISAGDYVAVRIDSANSQVLKGTPLFHTSLSLFDSSVLDFEDSRLKTCI